MADEEREIALRMGLDPDAFPPGALLAGLSKAPKPPTESDADCCWIGDLCPVHSRDARVFASGFEEASAFIGYKGLGDEFMAWALARRAEIDRLLELPAEGLTHEATCAKFSGGACSCGAVWRDVKAHPGRSG